MVPPSAQEEVFYVLKKGEILGPFALEELKSALEAGELTERDFIQKEGQPIWQPLTRVLAKSDQDARGAVAPDWQSITRWAWLRLRHDIGEQSLATGAVCLGIGAVAMVLSLWPVLFWLPWFGAAVIAAVALLQRQRAEHALLLLAGIVCLPFFFFVVGPRLVGSPVTALPGKTNGESDTTSSIAASQPAKPLSQEASVLPSNPLPVITAAAPAPIDAAEMPAPAASGLPPVYPEPLAPAVVPQPASPPAVVTTEPPVEASPSQIPAPMPEEAGILKRTVDFLSTLGSKPNEQPTTSAAIPAPALPSPPSLPSLDSPAVPRPASPDGNEKIAAGDFVQKHTDAFVVIKGRDGSGSGFVCRVGEQTYLFTNIHVIAGMQQAQFTRLNGSTISPGAAHAAAGHDILRFAVAEPAGQALEAMTDFANNVRIGDEVLALGNSGGGGVVTSLPGTVVGIGPDRIEVSAEFIPGNSGSPIVHVKTGKVIGVATYLIKRYDEFGNAQQGNAPSPNPAPPTTPPPRFGPRQPPSSEATPTPRNQEQGTMVVRRFAYRLDSVRTWEPVNWAIFQQESEQIRQISRLTEDVVGFIQALRGKRSPQFETETLRRPATQWLASIEQQRMSSADRLRSTESFLRTLRSMVRSDVTAAEARLRYSYFRDELRSEREVRDRLFEAFDVEAKRLASPSERFTR